MICSAPTRGCYRPAHVSALNSPMPSPLFQLLLKRFISCICLPAHPWTGLHILSAISDRSAYLLQVASEYTPVSFSLFCLLYLRNILDIRNVCSRSCISSWRVYLRWSASFFLSHIPWFPKHCVSVVFSIACVCDRDSILLLWSLHLFFRTVLSVFFYICTQFSVYDLSAIFRCKYYMVLAFPCRMC